MHFPQFQDHEGPSIWILDDDESIIELIEHMIEKKLPSKVTSFLKAEDLTAAIAQKPHVKPDLFILDIVMPGMDGIDVHDWIESHYLGRGLPPPKTLFFTGAGPDYLLEKTKGALTAWPNSWHVLSKPASSDVLISTIRRIIGF